MNKLEKIILDSEIMERQGVDDLIDDVIKALRKIMCEFYHDGMTPEIGLDLAYEKLKEES